MSKKICIIGAGPSGIAAAKNCLEAGLEFVVFEKNDKVGGNWVFNSKTGHSSVYENTHLISSKSWSEYEDYPMPDDYPDYPNHYQLQQYFEGYAKFFRLIFRYDTLGNYYQTNFALMQYHKYSLTELENMIPWERSIYVNLLVKYLQEEKERIELQKQTRRR